MDQRYPSGGRETEGRGLFWVNMGELAHRRVCLHGVITSSRACNARKRRVSKRGVNPLRICCLTLGTRFVLSDDVLQRLVWL